MNFEMKGVIGEIRSKVHVSGRRCGAAVVFFYLVGGMRWAILTSKLFDNYFLDPGMAISGIDLI